jgi:hypothetical protein
MNLTPMQVRILEATHRCVNYRTGETYVSAGKVAALVEHDSNNPKQEWATWSAARALGMITAAYAKPNEPKSRHFRRLLMPSNWRHAPDPDGGRRALPEPGSGEPIRESGLPDSGSGRPANPGVAHKDDLDPDQGSLSQNERTDQASSVSLREERGERSNDQPATGTGVGQLVEQLALGFEPVVGQLVERGVTTDDASRWLTRYGARKIAAQIAEHDRQRSRGVKINNPAAWFQSALDRGFAAPATSQAEGVTPPYAHQNAENAATSQHVGTIHHSQRETERRLARLSAEDRESLLRRAIDADIATYVATMSLRAFVDRLRERGKDPYESSRVLTAIGELLSREAAAS